MAGALGLGWLMVSTAAVVTVLAAPVPPLVIAAGRVAVTGLVWMAIAGWARVRSGRPRAEGLPHGMIGLSGILLGAHFALWIASLSITSVVHGAVLVALQPLFAGLFGLMLGERAPLLQLLGGFVVAGVGTALLTSSAASAEGASLVGDVLAIGAAACSALYLTVNRGIGDAVPLSSLLARVNLIAAATVALAIVLFGGDWWHGEARVLNDGLAIVWLGLGPGLIGHGLMNWAARRVPVYVVSLVVLLEPVGAAVLAWWLLDQRFGLVEAGGALLLLIGAAIASSNRA